MSQTIQKYSCRTLTVYFLNLSQCMTEQVSKLVLNEYEVIKSKLSNSFTPALKLECVQKHNSQTLALKALLSKSTCQSQSNNNPILY